MANQHTKNSVDLLVELSKLLVSEKSSLIIFLIYSFVISLLYLTVPLTAQIMVNTIAAGVLLQPLILLSLIVSIGFLFLGALKVMQLYIVEILQRKIFAKISLEISQKIPKIKQKFLDELYAPELVNRFFDIVTIQKSLSGILLEIPAAILQIVLGLVLMAIYSPFLIIFDLFFILAVFMLLLAGYSGLDTSVKESSSKYKVAYWLEETARCLTSFKMNDAHEYIAKATNNKIKNYIDDRKKHFHVLLRQSIIGFSFEGLATVSVLAIGGWLVINGKLTLGQLVAAELVVIIIISALEKIMQKIESWYDMLTAIQKVNLISDLESEALEGIQAKSNSNGAKIVGQNLMFAYKSEHRIFSDLNFEINPGARTSLVGISGSGKTSLALMIAGLIKPDSGKIFFNGDSVESLDKSSLRKRIALISNFGEIFSGSVYDNIVLGRQVADDQLEKIIDLVELKQDLKQFPEGLSSNLLSEGRNISLGQRQRILIARSLVGEPDLLIFDEAFAGMDENIKLKIVEKIFAKDKPWTILNITHDVEVVARTEDILLLDEARILESDKLQNLLQKNDSAFLKLFPGFKMTTYGNK